ncbi:MAG TPA: polyphosphate glucokinase [Marinilabiliales bacterium]|nr:MAG: polyphosphate glucokinase [Bacteroidetes bacterium GWA2_40_14]OFX58936.1 MAG: polyphosphate glucokinase [Bacteroidetes bacterium GWC2_40_13]OFX71307.1 MAG: polyphosphate glucokinase [Bacteroidetes bacterium GWD2_40_43]OFX91498.1 MAG: polyphosphate glucokinase [Bacteroidetes bacterium GWE2_40_63]OFY19660.1 MAG: polyphosphate glucokinase [Bacteroidetes bacterium GWF2_40_13]OFZ25498.1 MAG: polyphosphate glucokinase [Bacteroidetes bacterium RIFOXYC2_FULL_40_12]HAM97625.1 polyphosphate glu
MEVLGIDFGGTGIKGAPIDTTTAEILQERIRLETPQPSTPEAVADTIKQMIDHFQWKGKVGVGFPAVVQNGVVKTAANIDKSWIGVHVDQLLSLKTGCEVHAVNDADAAGMAELYHGAGKGNGGIVMLLTIGTGIGTTFFVNGELFPNTELGHIQFNKETVEKYASDAMRKKLDLNWKKWGGRLNEALTYYEQLFYPDLFIIGGGASKRMDKFQEYLILKTPVIPAQLQNNAGLIGAAMFASKK